MKKLVLLSIVLQIIFVALQAQYTNIPDVNFEQALIDLNIDDVSDGRVLTSNINTLTNLLIINRSIEDLTGIEDFTALTNLNCSYNNLETINISSNANLLELDCSENKLTNLSVSANTNLMRLTCSANRLTSLSVSSNAALEKLNCSKNQIASLNLNANSALLELSCASNQLTGIDISSNTALKVINCSDNYLNSVDFSNNIYLETILCSTNRLANIDISLNDSLQILDCSNNQLSELHCQNNLVLSHLTCTSNQLNNLDVSQNDSLVLLSIAENLLSSIDISNNDSLENLNCASNILTEINVSQNLILENIDVSSNYLASLNLSGHNLLASINCSSNQLQSLNIANGNNSRIGRFNALNNPDLICISVDDPTLAVSYANWYIDNTTNYGSNCVVYTYVPDDNFELALAAYDDNPNDNYIPTANIVAITSLDVSGLGIVDLTGVLDFTSLTQLNCSNNAIINLNLVLLPTLTNLNCSNNSLEALTLNSSAGGLTNLDAQNNPDLLCIQVDDVTLAEGYAGWLKDATASYNVNCNSNKTYIPDNNFEQALINLGYDKGGLDNYVITDSINTIQRLDIKQLNIFDLTGIEGFIALDSLDCSENHLSQINLNANIALRKLYCSGNLLSTIDLQNNTLLTELYCSNNNFENLDLSQNNNLEILYCGDNYLSGIDLTTCTSLIELNFNSNNINNSGIDLSANANLEKLYCSNNFLSTLDLSAKTLIKELDCSNNSISNINLQNTHDLELLDCSINKLASLDISADTVLTKLNCNSNLITSLDLSRNPWLREVNCSNNLLADINLNNNDSIRTFNASNNKLTGVSVSNMAYLASIEVINNQIASLDFSVNDSLKYLLCASNELNNLDVTNNIDLEILNCESNNLTNLDISNNINLDELNVSDNSITSIDLTSATALSKLVLDKNNLAQLNIFNNTNLKSVSCSRNSLIELDCRNNSSLVSLVCSSNELNLLNIQNGNNTNLVTFQSTDNPNLTCIEIDDENQVVASWVKDATASYAVNCHYAETYVPDDNFEAALSAIIGEASNNNDDYIPTADIEVLTVLDISNSNVSDLTGIEDFTALTNLNCSNNQIDSLGLGSNLNLSDLNCSNNLLDTIDLSLNQNIVVLNISANQLNNVDLSSLASLEDLNCSNNSLAQLDLIANSNLISLNCSSNQLEGLNVRNGNNNLLTSFNSSSNTNLYCIEVDDPDLANNNSGVYVSWIYDTNITFNENCHYNETYVPDDAFEQALRDLGYDNADITELDDYVPTEKIQDVTYLSLTNKGISDLTGIEGFTALVTLNCGNNNLSELNVGINQNLVTLICDKNRITSVDVSNNTELVKIDISDNLLTTLNINNNTQLERLLCSKNNLSSLNVLNNPLLVEILAAENQLISVEANNGFNANITNFDLRDNPDLRCILVDDIDAANGYSGWYKDITASYKIECNDDDNDGIIDVEDQCPNTPYGDLVDVYGCSIFILPSDNFSVITRSETCRAGNNGIVTITANEIYNYTATLYGTVDTIDFKFTTDVEIKNLRADTYKLCVTIEDVEDYEQCYQVVITQPEEFIVDLEVEQSQKKAIVTMLGASEYIIEMNGQVTRTNESIVDLELCNGSNNLKIKTEKWCQGTYEKNIFISDENLIFPNPFNENLNVFLTDEFLENIKVKIYSGLGKLVLSKESQLNNGLLQINTSKLKPGVYYLNLHFNGKTIKRKVIKE